MYVHGYLSMDVRMIYWMNLLDESMRWIYGYIHGWIIVWAYVCM